jgi:hypothetical protein
MTQEREFHYKEILYIILAPCPAEAEHPPKGGLILCTPVKFSVYHRISSPLGRPSVKKTARWAVLVKVPDCRVGPAQLTEGL